jgi:hypothetical protein
MMDFWGLSFSDGQGQPKQGHEYRTLHDIYGCAEIGIILRWQNGMLHDDGDLPAVDFEDTHIEHYRGGLLHNDSVDKTGKLLPAIIADYGTKCEYFVDGKQVTE